MNRRKKMARQMPPRQRRLYRQPILLDLVQQATPAATLWQDGSGCPAASAPHEYFGMNTYERPDEMTTPSG